MVEFDSLVPEIIDNSLSKKKFDHHKIYESLLRETSLLPEQAKLITLECLRTIIDIAHKIKTITAPLIREIINVKLLQYGFEKARLEYTRIGLPVFDITNLPSTYNITTHVLEEYKEVIKMIRELEK